MSTIETKENKIMEGEVDIIKPCISTILNEVYPEWKEDSPLPSDLLSICMEYLISERKMYHKNGSIASHGFMVNEKMYGVWKIWYASKNPKMNGKLVTQFIYNIFGKQTGQQLGWNAEQGTLAMVEEYVNGVKHGITKKWGRYKNLILEESYENGLLHGDYKRWDCDIKNTLLEHSTFVKGELHGPFKCWYCDGTLRMSGVYVKGQMLEIVTSKTT